MERGIAIQTALSMDDKNRRTVLSTETKAQCRFRKCQSSLFSPHCAGQDGAKQFSNTSTTDNPIICMDISLMQAKRETDGLKICPYVRNDAQVVLYGGVQSNQSRRMG